MRLRLLAVFAFLCGGMLIAQQNLKERESFVKDFEKLISSYAQKEHKEFIKRQLKPMLVETNDFSNTYFNEMVATYNELIEKRQRPIPVVYDYVYSVYSFVKTKQPESSFDAWKGTVSKLLGSRNLTKVARFLDLSASFFSERIISKSPSFDWLYRGGTYLFSYEKERPTMQFEGGNLVCLVETTRKGDKKRTFVDSIVVYGAKAVYDPILHKWYGEGGKITWEKAGLGASETFAELRPFEVSLKSSLLNCDSVMLTTPYFKNPIRGKLSERAFKINREEDKIYPQFISYNRRLEIKQIAEHVDYAGGFSLNGKDFVGLGAPATPATLKISRNGKEFVFLKSQRVTVNKEKISSKVAGISIYIGTKDSITHPGLDFTYDLKNNLLEFVRNGKGISQSPFSNSYHQVDMYIPKLSWEYDSPEVMLTYNFGTSQEQRYARLESKNYFDGRLYDQLQGLDKVHPLAAIADYCYKYDEYVMDEGKIATAMRQTIEQAKPTLLRLASLGFISYDTESKIVRVNQKLINFAMSKSKKMDYDNLMFLSDMRPKKLKGYSQEQIDKEPYLQKIVAEYDRKNKQRQSMPNFGVFNLGTMEIRLVAVDMISISDFQNTAVFPEESKIVLKENRNFDFSGWVASGKLEVNTLEANYIYKTNKVNLFKTDKSVFRVRPMRKEDGQQLITMVNQIQGITGELLVDDPENRSGNNLKISDFPKLVVSKPAKVYYNSKAIYGGVYDSTRFYYTMDPFEMDSLDNFKELSQRWEGELTSAGIFPKFREPLKIMPDYSFGFVTKAQKGGYDFYSTTAKYDDKIVLSGNGLQGAGTINFVHATAISKAYTFLPDSTVGYAQFENKAIEEDPSFPDIKSPEAYVTYVPKGKVLKAASTPREELKMFDGEARIKGTVFIKPEGATGTGVATFVEANLGAKKMSFTRWEIDSDTANFNLKNRFKVDDEDPLALKTENLNAHISFKDRKGEFRSNAGESKVEFPINQYYCKMDFFTWFMDEEVIELSSKADQDLNLKTDLDLVGANFFSTHPDQDSLRFKSREAKYSMRKKTLYCSKIDYMDIADARIYPDSGKIIIRKKARIDPLENSVIIANSITKYHKFVNATTKIKARRKYESVGDYPYYDADSTMTMIQMKEIGVDSTFQTVAEGKIGPNDNFKLSKQFDYYGDVRINSNVPFISFSGATRINHNCEKFTRSWMAFQAEIDPKNIQIPVSNDMKSLDSLSLSAGIVWSNAKSPEDIRMYPTFLSELGNKKDQVVFTSNGVLQYDMRAKEFQIGSKEKLINRNEKGNYLALHVESCSLNGDGVIDLGMDFGPVTVDAVGVINYDQGNGRTSMNVTAKYNVPLEEKTTEKIAEKILKTEEMKPMDFASTTYEKALVEWTDRETADKIKSDYTVNGAIKKIPKTAKAAFVITGLRLSSFENPKFEERGIYSDVESAALVSIYDKPVAKYLPVKAFFQQIYSGNGGDHFGLLLTNPGGDEYYFDYSMSKKDGEMKVYTSDAELETAINELKGDKKKSKNFSYELTSNRLYLSKFSRLFGVK
ncbi:MAG: hypothetical protein EP338_00210 [Bacteroidetes bacterium]|nr:MAG: hypothetical protein EP338_00210 [Bacteroidota bacterium]